MNVDDQEIPIFEPDDWDSATEFLSDTNANNEIDKLEKEISDTKKRNKIFVLNHSKWIIIGFLYFMAATFAVASSIWLWHYLSPFGWLSEAQLSKIQTVFFSSALGAIVSSTAKDYLK